MPTSQNFIILGTAFMKNYYVIFDYERDALGISNLNTNANIFNGKAPQKKASGGTEVPTDDTTRANDGNSITIESLLNTKDPNVIYAILIAVILLLVIFIMLLIFCIYYYGFKS